VPRFAPRLSPRLVAAIERLDDGKISYAELRRLVGAEADRLDLPRPSYERVRTLAQDLRTKRAEITTGEVLVDVALRLRTPEAVTQQIAGTLPPK
jgi:hypothetical protein